MKALILFLILSATSAFAQQKAPEGIWEGYDGEWRHVSEQLIALAEATPAEKFAFRPVEGVRSTSEVYMHIVMANFYLLSVTGPKMPADLKDGMEKSVTSKADVIAWLKRSLEAVKTAHASVTPKDLLRKVKIADREATVDGMYLRIIV
ncbi:MAG TPA: DinB family protein, partial [Candidatus Angelobacter sp.]|nr:DinB family protein [Candidatus Angelobacter sp.]